MAIESDDIESTAQTPRKAQTDEGMVEERPISELIEADRYAASKTAASKVPWGLRMARIKPGGTV